MLEACVKSCGTDFHSELGKFRFLNELVKLVSPKYSGTITSDLVKQKIIELLYLWTIQIPYEKKISEAYEMLKSQGLISSDPDYVKSSVFPVSATPRKVDLDDAESQKLQKLLHSKDPVDIESANRIIKGMVKKDEEKMEMISKRVNLFESVNTNIKLLTEMMNNYTTSDPAETRELITDLGEACEKLRPNLYRIAAQLEDDDEAIGEVLLLSDELNKVIDRYRSFFTEESASNSRVAASVPAASADLLGIDQDIEPSEPELSSIVLDDILDDKNLFNLEMKSKTASEDLLSSSLTPLSTEKSRPECEITASPPALCGLDSLDPLGENLLGLSGHQRAAESRRNAKLPMNELMKVKSEPETGLAVRDLTAELLSTPPIATTSPAAHSQQQSSQDELVNIPNTETASSPTCSTEGTNLTDVTVEMSDIQPDPSLAPLTLQSPETGVAVTAHFTENLRSQGLAVLVVTVANHHQAEISEILLKPVVSKGFKVKALPLSCSSLSPLTSVFSPPATATTIIIIAKTSPASSSSPCSFSFFLSFTRQAESESLIGQQHPLPDKLWTVRTSKTV